MCNILRLHAVKKTYRTEDTYTFTLICKCKYHSMLQHSLRGIKQLSHDRIIMQCKRIVSHTINQLLQYHKYWLVLIEYYTWSIFCGFDAMTDKILGDLAPAI